MAGKVLGEEHARGETKGQRMDDPHAAEIVQRILSDFAEHECEALRRFYSFEQSPEQICRELSLRAAEFWDIKKRAFERYRAARASH